MADNIFHIDYYFENFNKWSSINVLKIKYILGISYNWKISNYKCFVNTL